MSEIADRYRRLSNDLSDTIRAVPADRWSSPSPCDGWTARDVVRHVVESQTSFLGFVGREVPELPSVDDDPVAAFDAARAVVQADLDDPERAAAGFDGFAGPTTFEAAVDRFASFDLLVHRWDVAKATGLEVELPADEVARVRGDADAFGPMLRTEGVCGAEVEVGPDASAQDQLLAYLGRHP